MTPPETSGGVTLPRADTVLSPSQLHTAEDRRFFLRQYIRTTPLNALSVMIKSGLGFAWAILDNAPLLGYFSLASTPSSISQQGQFAGALVQAILPNTTSTLEDRSLISAAFFVDLISLATVALITMGFFFATKAPIVTNLGSGLLMVVTTLSLFETLPALMVQVCNAKRNYYWNFMISNIRIILLILMLVWIRAQNKYPPRWGIILWVATTLCAFLLSHVYFQLHSLLPTWNDVKRPGSREFIHNMVKKAGHLIFFRLSWLLFTSVASLFIAFIHDTTEVGLFAFALTLSGLLYTTVAPINEQVFSPSISRLVYQKQPKALIRRLFQMAMISLVLSAAGSAALLAGGKPALILIHKHAFLDCFKFLPALLAFQTFKLIGGGYTYSLFCMNRFRALGAGYLLSAIGTAGWCLFYRSEIILCVWGLTVAPLILTGLCLLYHLYLDRTGKNLLARSFYSFTK